MLLNTDGETALSSIAEQVRAAVERGRIRRSEGSESIGGVTVSIGIACSRDGEQFESLMLRADRALYQSKAGGRNRCMHRRGRDGHLTVTPVCFRAIGAPVIPPRRDLCSDPLPRHHLASLRFALEHT